MYSIEVDDYVSIDEIDSHKGLVIVDVHTNKRSVASQGMLAFKRNTMSLIINVDEIDYYMLDESNIRILFIGNKVRKFTNDYFMQKSLLRYVYVDENNLYFSSYHHVLFNKDQTVLYCYASLKNEVKYKVDVNVKCIKKYN